jgi:hypothetical protein
LKARFNGTRGTLLSSPIVDQRATRKRVGCAIQKQALIEIADNYEQLAEQAETIRKTQLMHSARVRGAAELAS